MRRKLGSNTLKVGDILDEFEKDEVKKKIDIVSLFESFGVSLKQKGKSHMGRCPFGEHEDKTPSLSVDRAKGVYHCFGCGRGGDAFTLVSELKGYTFPEALKYLKERVGLIETKLVRASELVESDASAEFTQSEAEVHGERTSDEGSEPSGTEQLLPSPSEGRRRAPGGGEIGAFRPSTSMSGGELMPSWHTDRRSESAEAGDEGEIDDIGRTRHLTEAVEFYHRRLYENDEALTYLAKDRGIEDVTLYERFNIGYCDGTLLERIGTEKKKELIRIGILKENENSGKIYEHFLNCIIFPIVDELGNIVGIYGRSINPDAKVKHLYLPGKHISVFNRKASRVFENMIIAESIIDALSLIAEGIENVQSAYGVNGFTDEHLEILKEDRVKRIVIAFDSDEAGRKAAEKLKERLIGEGFRVETMSPNRLPSQDAWPSSKRSARPGGVEVKDWNEHLTGSTPDEMKELKEKFKEEFERLESRGSEPSGTEPSAPRPAAPPPAGPVMKKNASGYTFEFLTGEKYEVLNFKEDYAGALKVILKAEAYGKHHCDDFNLYSYRSRENFAKQSEYLTTIPAAKGSEQILEIIEKLEEIRNKRIVTGEEEKEEELTEEEKQIGMKFLENPLLFEELKSDLTAVGCVGEDRAKVLLYLVAVSRLRSTPLSVYVLGRSSGGKSHLVKSVLKLVPETGKYVITKISPEVIYYMEKGLMNKVVMIGEFDGADEIEYLLRELVSDGQVSKLVTLKDPQTGLPKPQHVVSQGPISLISTSTRPEDLNPENLSRCILMHVDESADHTEYILKYHRFITGKEGMYAQENIEEVTRKHHIAQRLLEDVKVFNSFGDDLDFPTLILLARRAHFNFLQVIEMAAFVTQKQHEVSEMELRGERIRYIETNDKDYEVAYDLLMDGIMEDTLDEMPMNAKNLHKIMLEMVREKGKKEGKTEESVYLDRREVMNSSGWTSRQLKVYVRILLEYGYLEVVAGKVSGQKHKYRVLNVQSRVHELLKRIPTPEDMRKRLRASGKK